MSAFNGEAVTGHIEVVGHVGTLTIDDVVEEYIEQYKPDDGIKDSLQNLREEVGNRVGEAVIEFLEQYESSSDNFNFVIDVLIEIAKSMLPVV